MLENIGLTQQQAKVYIKLLELGPSNAGKLVKEIDIERVSCYDTLNRLIRRGLVSFLEIRGHRLYQATNPQRLLKFAEDAEEKAKKQKETVQLIIPELAELQKTGLKEQKEATIYKTKEGVKSIFEMMLDVGKPINVISATGKAIINMNFYFPMWNKKRVKKNILVKIIFNNELRKSKITKMPLSEVKFMPKEYSSPSTLFVFGEYVANLLWSDVPFVFLIKSSEIAKSYQNYFNMIWNLANK